MIALIDYKAGNLTSVRKALAAVGADLFTPETPADLGRARGVIVPGVGHFQATLALDPDWVETIRGLVADGCPLFGICLGMQWLFEASDEAPDVPGLGVMSGRCYRLGTAGFREETTDLGSGTHSPVKVPHVGWNTLERRSDGGILEHVPDHSQVYFTHSYVAPITEDTVAATEHGEPFASVVERGHIAGVQFHPEKSGNVGLQILRNFVRRAT